MDMYEIRSGISNFVILNRFSFCRASTLNLDRKDSVKVLINSTSSLVSWSDLHDFNTKLEHLFLEILNPSQIYPITSKVRFVKGLANYIKYVPKISHMS